MAEKTANKQAKKRQLKKVETVRERAVKTTNEPVKQRRIKQTASTLWRPFGLLARFFGKLLSPFAFLLWPFKTRPARMIGRVLAAVFLFRFFREAWAELRQVQWPTARETVRLTTAVFLFSILFGVLIAVTDYGLDKIFRKVFID